MANTLREWEMEQMFGKEKKESDTKKEEKAIIPDVSCKTCSSKASKKLELKIDENLVFPAKIIEIYLCEHCNSEITKDCEIRAERDRIKNGY